MLNENIKTIRKSKGLSQEELAVKLNVVRQTVSKWEQGLSVPDSDMLISPFGRARNSREHTARRECRKAGSGRAESNMRKARGDKPAARAKKNCEKSGASLAVYCTLRGCGNYLGGADIARQSVSRLEFRRPGNCGFRHCLSCVRVAVCPICADSFCRFARRSFYDAKEMICLICPLPIGRGIFRVENAAGCGIIKAGNQ